MIPNDFTEMNLFVIVAFQRWHQNLVNEFIEKLELLNIHLTHTIIEVPLVSELPFLKRMRLDAIMRAGIRDYKIRQRTITVYTNKEDFRLKLGIPDENEIYWYVVDHSTKHVLWSGRGVITSDEISQIMLSQNQ